MSSGLDREAFLAGYLAEVEEHISSSGKNLLAIEEAQSRREPHPRAVRELYRSLHTIKGLSAMVGIEPIVDLAHAMEEIARTGERAGGRLGPRAVDALADGMRAIEQRIRAVAERRPVPAAPTAVLEKLAAQVDEGGSASFVPPIPLPGDLAGKLTPVESEQIARGVASGHRLVRVDFVPSPELAAQGLNITAVRERVGAIAEVVRVIPFALPRSDAAPAGLSFTLLVLSDRDPVEIARAAGVDPASLSVTEPPPRPVEEPEEALPHEDHAPRAAIVRVEVGRLDAALERLSALVVTRMRMLRALATMDAASPGVRALREIIEESGRQLRELRAAITQARMVSVAELLERVPLVVRGLARSTGKEVRLEIDAGRAELDKSVAERIFPAVVHLVRNAVDHAIESPAERRAAGKPEAGLIRVRCSDLGDGRLELAIEDDGRGVDREAVARRAGRPVPTTHAELLELLATPGLSTAERATTTSGRGLGVDIARRVADELGGELRLVTRPGSGTTFTLRVPLSITIVDAFSFSSSGQPYVVPVAGVEEILDVEPASLVRSPRPDRGGLDVGLIERRGEAVPLVRLDELLGTSAGRQDGFTPKAILVRRASPVAFIVDRMLGHQEVVVRPLEDPLVKVAGVTGATDLGDGRPTLVLDLGALSTRLHLGAPS